MLSIQNTVYDESQFQQVKSTFVVATKLYGFGAVCYIASVGIPGKGSPYLFQIFAYASKAIAALLFLYAAYDSRKVDSVSARRLTAHSVGSAVYIIASEILMANLTPLKNPFNHDVLTTLKISLHAALFMTDCYTAYKMRSLDTEYERSSSFFPRRGL